MTPELWQRLKPLYEEALEIPLQSRDKFVDEACGTSSELKEELNALLEATEEKSDTFDEALIQICAPGALREKFFRPGELILGRFQIVRHLGSGGMGDVYEANDLDLKLGRIALKTIRPTIAENPGALARFKEEVILARKVSGPHVCRIHELFVVSRDPMSKCVAILTMEFLAGATLSQTIARGVLLPIGKSSEIAAQLCSALQSIHDAGVIHRDLKPGNIMLVPRDGVEKVVVMDFGLARVLSRGLRGAETALTSPGMIMGTPDYMAPEQFDGSKVGPATDIYAFGLIFYELVTGKKPFVGQRLDQGRFPIPPSSIRHEVPPSWDAVIAKCLEYDPAQRYQSAGEVIEALREHRLVIWRRQRGYAITVARKRAAISSAVILIMLTLVGWSWIRHERYRPPSPEVKRWYDLGMTALREGSYLKATRALSMAVQVDAKFALAHAALAEAWAELDFTGPAEREMLFASAPEQQRDLPYLDRKYIDAIRTTLIRDYSAATQDYEAILNALPPDQKAQGYVDLGRAYEKSGKVHETMESYEKAAHLNPDDPAPFLHLGILKSRQRDPAGSEVAFNRAQTLYEAGSNLEGLAEVDYQRGYAANEAAASERAIVFLNKSLAIAREIPSVQLEVRSLSQLSSVAYNDGHDDQAIAYANQAIQLARDNGLEYWSTDGLMRLGNAYLDKEDFGNAESSLEQALQLARKNQHPRLEAASELSLASVRNQQGRWNEEIDYAQAALKYYQDFGFMEAADSASTLIVRGERGKGNLAKAQQSGVKLLSIAEQTNSELSVELAEELVGGVSLDLQQYPEALSHYERALKASQSLHENEGFQALHCANALWRLGRYAEAETMLTSISSEARKRKDIGSGIDETRAEIRLSRGDARGALRIATNALISFSGMRAGKVASFERIKALAEAELGYAQQAKRDADEVLAVARHGSDEGTTAEAELVGAEVALRLRDPIAAIPLAQDAQRYFASKGEKESEWLSLLCEAQAMKASGNAPGGAEKAARALDIMHEIEQSWSASDFHTYMTRPDRQREFGDLSRLRLT